MNSLFFSTQIQVVEWIKQGDIETAKSQAKIFRTFLGELIENQKAQKALSEAGISFFDVEFARLVYERLLDNPRVDMKAQEDICELIKAGERKGSSKIAEAQARAAKFSPKKGQSSLSGLELFAKFLVPNKPSSYQVEIRWLAETAALNLQSTSKAEYKRVTKLINEAVVENIKIMAEWKAGKRNDLTGWSHFPKRRITEHQLEVAHRKYKPEIDKKVGITRHRIAK